MVRRVAESNPKQTEKGIAMVKMTLGSRIKARRKALRYSQGAMAKMANWSQGCWSQVERGRVPTEKRLKIIAKVLGVSVARLRG